MAGQETEQPFANSVSSIARDIAPDSLEYDFLLKAQLADLKVHEAGLSAENYTAQEASEVIVTQMRIGPLPGVHKIIAAAFVHTPIFEKWAEVDKRYLLDRAVGEDILRILTLHDRQGAQEAIYGKFGRRFTDEKVAPLRRIRTRIREKATPSSGAMRK